MVDLTGKTAIVTGAGGGLGRAHALALAAHGARVVVNDLGGQSDGGRAVVEEIVTRGGEALLDETDITDFVAVTDMVAAVEHAFGGVDILVNNAGILRDRSFAKMEVEDFRAVIEVHLMGSVHCTKAVWAGMRERGYGRIVLTTSSSGLFGNFGQANYAAAKMGLVGLMQTLRLEGEKYNIRVNCLSPSAATRMTDGLYGADDLLRLDPKLVAPSVVALAADSAPNGAILCAGAGSFESAHILLTQGVVAGESGAAEAILDRWTEIEDRDNAFVPAHGPDQFGHEIARASTLLSPVAD
ncbi:SDR family NAD(P)-dependent oxidoreductase [Novosphingobium sp. SG707]|uniref:SDR family NAD(P)-dependent oxidoreductase n=1 Tax=Novosphingobium sp. SG707 TaxID=2586996 RepID=UPI001853A865|nr:SDR family NAD(P)-dependent oxidoreductase [Novosphingobium sp. SG707]NKJ00929.1 NAD(P)-dependent dehydrogenase (short-subunit alcohol dehydrogenase family) [Novosphingobium sp. SG707]